MNNNPPIFRPKAIRRYLDRRERTVFPVYAAPRTTLCVLLLSAILAAGVLLAALARVPAYARGEAVLIGREGETVRDSGESEAAIFVSPEVLSKIKVGQRVFLRAGAKGWLYSGRIKALAPGAQSPTDVRTLLNFDSLPDGILKERAAFALAGPIPSGLTPEDSRGGVLEVRVEIGERRLLSFGSIADGPGGPLNGEISCLVTGEDRPVTNLLPRIRAK
jgi:hypothetical protein